MLRVFTSLMTATSFSHLGSAAFNLPQPYGEGWLRKPNSARLYDFFFLKFFKTTIYWGLAGVQSVSVAGGVSVRRARSWM